MIIVNLFESDIKKSCKEQKVWFRRLRDMTMYKGSSSPADFILYFDDIPLLVSIECKMLRSRKGGNPKSFPFSMVSEDQEEGLRTFSKLENALGLVLVNFRHLNNKKGEVFILTADEYFEYKQGFLEGRYDYRNTKSIPLEFLRDNCCQLYRQCKGWDLSQLRRLDI